MDLLQLEYFCTVAKCEHMTQAAQKLHISQPTLSQVIARLEKELGTELFDRCGRRIALNENGKLLLDRASFILTYIENTKAEFKKASAKETNDIYLRMHTGHYIFSEILKEFKQSYPYVQFHLLMEDQPFIDALSVQYSSTWTDSLNGCYLFDDEICLLVSDKSSLAQKKSIDLRELKAMNFINNRTGFLKDITQPYCERAGFIPNFAYVAPNNDAVVMLIETDYGIAFWPKMALSEISLEHIAVLRIQRPLCIRSMFLIYPENRQLTQLEQAFVKFCQESFQNQHI